MRRGLATLARLVDAHCDDLERDRRLPRALADCWRAAGWLRLWLPREYGGAECDPETVFDLAEEVAALDGSVGWNLFNALSLVPLAAHLPEPAAQAIWGSNPDALIAGVFRPAGRARPAEGGYRVSGRWGFASNVHNADWLCANCLVIDGERPGLDADGTPQQRLVVVPAADAAVVDTWETGGLRGTGSHDFVLHDVLVPDGFCVDLSKGRPRIERPLYQLPVLSLGSAGVASVALGIARRAIGALVDLAADKVPVGSRALLKERPLAQIQVARADALVGAGRAFLVQAVRDAWRSVVASGEAAKLEQSRLTLAAVHAAESAAEAVGLMYKAAGASAVYSSSPIDRCMRDVHAAAQHLGVSTQHYQSIGQVLLERLAPHGLPRDEAQR